MNAFNPAYAIDSSFLPKPKSQGSNDILALSRMYQGMYNKPPQYDLSGVTDIGSGIAKGAQNILNMVQYRGQQRQQEAWMADLQAQAQAEALAQQQEQAAALQLQQQKAQQQYNVSLALAQGNKTPETLAQAQMLGLGTPVANISNAYGTVLGDINSADARIQALRDRNINMAPVDATGQPMPPSVDAVNAYSLFTGQKPVTGIDLASQLQALKSTTIGNAQAAGELANQPTVIALKNEGMNLGNEGQRYQNYITQTQANFAGQMEQAKLDAQRVNTAEKTQSLNNLTAANNMFSAAVKDGSIYDPKKIPILQAQMQALGASIDLLGNFTKLANPKSGVSLEKPLAKIYPIQGGRQVSPGVVYDSKTNKATRITK